MPETEWLYAGVPNGVRGSVFFKLDQTKEGRSWSRHKFSMLTANPRFLASRRYRREIEESFGGRSSPDYITQVTGQWGDVASNSFPPGSVSWDLELPYYVCRATGTEVTNAIKDNTLPALLKIPQVQCYQAVIGWDYGFSPDCTTFVLCVRYSETGPWQTYARVALYATMLPRQIEVLKHLWVYTLNGKCAMLSIDSPESYQMLLSDENKFIFNDRIKATNQAGTVEYDLITGKAIEDKAEKVDAEFLEHRREGNTKKIRRKQFLTDLFRKYMNNQIMGSATDICLVLGKDDELESELIATVERRTESGYVVFDVPKSKATKMTLDQATDAMRAVCDCIFSVTHNGESEEFGLEEMLNAMGWSAKRSEVDKWEAEWLS
jgi:hypothetical protein